MGIIMIKSIIALVCTTLCLAVTPCLAADTAKPPTIAQILRALERQNAATVEVHYTREFVSSDRREVSEGKRAENHSYVYIRTPEMLYMKTIYPSGFAQLCLEYSSVRSGVDGMASFVDKATLPDGKWRSRRQTRVYPTVWEGSNRMETLLYPLDKRASFDRRSFVYSIVSVGRVLPEMQKIDGHDCWKVKYEPTGKKPLVKLYEIWLDSTIGFCPRKAVSYGVTGWMSDVTYTAVVSFNEYKEIADGIWFPQVVKTMINGWPKTGESRGNIYTATEIYGDKPYSKADLTLKFPPELKTTDPNITIKTRPSGTVNNSSNQ